MKKIYFSAFSCNYITILYINCGPHGINIIFVNIPNPKNLNVTY